MKTIYKYPLEVVGSQNIAMPKGAEILSVQMQHGSPTIWALVDDTASSETRCIDLFGTGHEVPQVTFGRREYIGTVQDGQGLVWHLFEKQKLFNS